MKAEEFLKTKEKPGTEAHPEDEKKDEKDFYRYGEHAHGIARGAAGGKIRMPLRFDRLTIFRRSQQLLRKRIRETPCGGNRVEVFVDFLKSVEFYELFSF